MILNDAQIILSDGFELSYDIPREILYERTRDQSQ